MKLVWNRDAGILAYHDQKIPVKCDVRNELNGRRKTSEPVVRTETKDGKSGVPYMPRVFPKGLWSVVHIKEVNANNTYEAPFFISTDAHQSVPEWTEASGKYGVCTGREVEDYGYGLHFSTSLTTLGCGRVCNLPDLLALVVEIRAAWDRKEDVTLEVV